MNEIERLRKENEWLWSIKKKYESSPWSDKRYFANKDKEEIAHLKEEISRLNELLRYNGLAY